MSCADLRALLDAHMDGELELARTVELEKHLATCAACAAAVESRLAQRRRLRSAEPNREVSRELQGRVRGALRQEAGVRRPKPILAIASGLAAALLIALVYAKAPRTDLAGEFADNHARSMQGEHLFDVASSDRHTVKPWFQGRLPFSPPVRDLTADGFPLAGGRTEFLDGRAVAALVYKRKDHVINVYVWPSDSAPDAPREIRGFNCRSWNAEGFAFWTISDLNARELEDFSSKLRAGGN